MSDPILRERDSLRKSMTLSVAAIAVQFPFSVIAQTLAGRITGVEGFGEFGYIQTGVFLVFPFVGFPAVFGIPMYVAANPPETRRVHTALMVSLTGFLVFGVICTPLWSWVSSHVPGIRNAGTWDAATWMLGATALAYRAGVEFIFVGNRDFLRRGVIALLHPVLFAVVTAVLYVSRTSLSGGTLFGYWTGSLCIAAFASWALVRNRLEGPRGWNLATARKLSALGLRGMVVVFAGVWLYRSPFLVAERRLSAATLGLWTGINALSEMVRQVTGALGRALVPFAARQSMKTATVLTVQLLGLIAILGFAIVLVAPTTLMQILFGNEFHDPNYVFVTSYPGIVAAGIATVIAQALSAWGYPRVTYIAPSVATVSGILLYTLQRPLTPTWFGMTFTISQSVALGLQLFAYHRGEALRLRDWFDPSGLASAIRTSTEYAFNRIMHRGNYER